MRNGINYGKIAVLFWCSCAASLWHRMQFFNIFFLCRFFSIQFRTHPQSSQYFSYFAKYKPINHYHLVLSDREKALLTAALLCSTMLEVAKLFIFFAAQQKWFNVSLPKARQEKVHQREIIDCAASKFD